MKLRDCFGKDKIDKTSAKHLEKKRLQINKIVNEIEIIIDTTETQEIVKKYYEQLYANKFDNLEKTDTFLDAHNNLRLNQEEIK